MHAGQLQRVSFGWLRGSRAGRTGLRSKASLPIDSLQSNGLAAETELTRRVADANPAEIIRFEVSIPWRR